MLIGSFCEKYTLQFDNKHVFDLHLSLVHGEKIKLKNEPVMCEEKFQDHHKSEKEFQNNLVENHLKCDVCNSFLKNEQNVERHIQSVHKSVKFFRCNTCAAHFNQKRDLNRHVASVHEGKKILQV